MKKVLRKLLMIAAVLVAVPVVLVAALFYAAALGCENAVLSQAMAPDGAHKAVVFERSCGATTGFSTQVSILPAEARLPDEAGNAFVADTDRGNAPAGEHGGPLVQVRWLAPGQVEVSAHPAVRVFHAPEKVGDVRIERAYQE